MKKLTANCISIFAALVVASLCPFTTHAQAEVSPDTHETKNATPAAPPPSVKTEFHGEFSLANQVQCSGHKLAAGKYHVIVKTVGEGKMVTLQRDGNDIVLTVLKTSPPTSSDQKTAVLVRHGPGPGGHTLEAVYCEVLNMVLYLDESGHTKGMDKMFAGLKRVPVSKAD